MDFIKKNKYTFWLSGLILMLCIVIFLLNRKYRIEPMEHLEYQLKQFPVTVLNHPGSDGFYKVPEESIKTVGNTPYGYVFRRYVFDQEYFFDEIQVEYKIVGNDYYIRPSVITTSDLELMLFPDDTLYLDRGEFHFFACPWYEKAVARKTDVLKTLKNNPDIQ